MLFYKFQARLETETATSSIITPDNIEKESCGWNLNTGKQLSFYILAYEHVFKWCAAFYSAVWCVVKIFLIRCGYN